MTIRPWAVVVLAGLGILLMARKTFAAVLKSGVTLGPVLKPTTRRIVDAAEYVFGRYGITPVITSGTDGQHASGSLHYSGDALDLRRWDADAKGVTNSVVSELIWYLGDDYDVILERDHIHVEFDPK